MSKLISPDAIVSKKAVLEDPVRVYAFAGIQSKAEIGRYSVINRHAFVSGRAVIGRYCSISRAAEVGALDHPMNMLSTHTFQYSTAHFDTVPGYTSFERDFRADPEKTQLGHDVLIGVKGIVRAGVTVGTGAVIEPNSYVDTHVPPYAVVAGSPAQVTHFRFPQITIEKLLLSNWWDLAPQELQGVAFDDVDLALEQIQQAHADVKAAQTAETQPENVEDNAVVAGLTLSLRKVGISDDVVGLVMKGAPDIARLYDPSVASDQDNLRHKLAYLIDFMAERDAATLSVNERNHISSLFLQKE